MAPAERRRSRARRLRRHGLLPARVRLHARHGARDRGRVQRPGPRMAAGGGRCGRRGRRQRRALPDPVDPHRGDHLDAVEGTVAPRPRTERQRSRARSPLPARHGRDVRRARVPRHDRHPPPRLPPDVARLALPDDAASSAGPGGDADHRLAGVDRTRLRDRELPRELRDTPRTLAVQAVPERECRLCGAGRRRGLREGPTSATPRSSSSSRRPSSSPTPRLRPYWWRSRFSSRSS